MAQTTDRTTVVYVETDRYQGIEGYSWWEVPVSEVSTKESVQAAYQEYDQEKKAQRYYLKPPLTGADWED